MWTAAAHQGYGQFREIGHNVLAHRYAYEQVIGPIPDGLFVLHSCDNPPCVNAYHMFLGGHAENAADKAAKKRARNGRENITHCPQGHPYEGDNVRIRDRSMHRRGRTLSRECVTCTLIFDRARPRRKTTEYGKMRDRERQAAKRSAKSIEAIYLVEY